MSNFGEKREKSFNNSMTENRTAYFDYLRVLANYAVIVIHVVALGIYVFDVSSSDWKVLNFYTSIFRWCVPVFLMISGALFLNRDDITLKKLFTKYVFRLFTAYWVWSFVYYLFDGDSVKSQLFNLIKYKPLESIHRISQSRYHLWFVPMIICIYICIPIIKQIVKNQKASLYFLLLSFIYWLLIPQINVIFNDCLEGENLIFCNNSIYEVIQKFTPSLVTNFIFYFVLGYELSKRQLKREQRIIIYIMGLIGAVFTVYMNQFAAGKSIELIGNYGEYNRVNVAFEAVAIFELFKNIPFKTRKSVVYLSKLSFGAYLVHDLFIQRIKVLWVNELLTPYAISIPIIALFILLMSFAFSALLRLIPYLNKYIV